MTLNKGKIFLIISILFVSILMFVRCSTSVKQKEIGEVEIESPPKDEIILNVKKIYSWINAMPGAKPRFHVTGELEILDDPSYDLEQIKIIEVTILQDNRMVFMFKPKVKEDIVNDTKIIIFSTVRGLLLNAALNEQKQIDIMIEFDDGSTTLKYIISKVNVEKAV